MMFRCFAMMFSSLFRHKATSRLLAYDDECVRLSKTHGKVPARRLVPFWDRGFCPGKNLPSTTVRRYTKTPKLPLVPLHPFRQGRNERRSLINVAERLDVRQSRRRPLGSLPPLCQRTIDHVRFRIVVS